MSRVESPSESVKEVAGDDCEIQRLSGGDIALTIEDNGVQTLVVVATDEARAVIAVDEPGVIFADAIEAAYDFESGLDRLLTAPFGGEFDG